MSGDLRLMFLSGFWMPRSQILLWFKKCAALLILVLALLLFCETHTAAFRLERVLELILDQPPHSIEETEAQNLVVGTEHPASWLGRVVRKLSSHSIPRLSLRKCYCLPW